MPSVIVRINESLPDIDRADEHSGGGGDGALGLNAAALHDRRVGVMYIIVAPGLHARSVSVRARFVTLRFAVFLLDFECPAAGKYGGIIGHAGSINIGESTSR